MFSRPQSPVGVTVAAALLVGLIPGPLPAADGDRCPPVRFLSPAGEVLPADYPLSSEARTFFVIHGFQSSGTSPGCLELADAIQRRFTDANVVIVDWRASAEDRGKGGVRAIPVLGGLFGLPVDYRAAAEFAPRVGKEIADWMARQGIRPSKTVICGHSLGAQVAAFASNECARRERFGERVWAILAADPARPRFQDEPSEKRLDKDDAREVIVIHATKILGDASPLGTVDVYIVRSDGSPPNELEDHSRARELLAESFRDPEMTHDDGTPFGANALEFRFREDRPRRYTRIVPRETELPANLTDTERVAAAAAERLRPRAVLEAGANQ